MNQSSVTPQPQGGSSTMKWLLIILVIIIVLGGGYWAYVKYGKTSATTSTASPSPATSVKASPSTSAAVSPSASSNVPTDWKTYTDFAYSFKYPADWEVEKETSSTGVYSSVVSFRPQSMKEDFVGSISISSEIPDKAVERLKGQYLTNSKLESETTITFAGAETIKLVFTNNVKPTIRPVVYIVTKGPLYIITGEGTTEGGNNDIAKQIISTFQFTQ